MKQPLQICFLGMEPSQAVETAARERAQKLDRFCPDLMSCRVTIELAHKHQQQGRPIAVRVDVTLPEIELTVDRSQGEDVYIALRDAFDDMTRRLEETVRKRRDQTQRASAGKYEAS
jgi:ribosomal subunit interface protein